MSSSRYILCIVTLLCVVLAAQHSVSSAAASGAPQALLPKPTASPLYIIQPNDILEISVWKEATVSRSNVLVRPDGRITIALAQDVQAAGLNPQQLKESLEALLKDYIDIPAHPVTVIVTSIQSYIVYVSGNVAKIGPITSPTPLTVLKALTTAGGTTQFARKREVVIIRGDGEDTRKFLFNFDEVISGTNYSQNFLLKSGDVVHVP